MYRTTAWAQDALSALPNQHAANQQRRLSIQEVVASAPTPSSQPSSQPLSATPASGARRTTAGLRDAGLLSGHYLDLRLAAELRHRRHAGGEITLIVINIDGLDVLEHLDDDACPAERLEWLGEQIAHCCRKFDAVCRLDRNQLAVVLPACPAHHARTWLERTMKHILAAARASQLAPLPTMLGVAFGIASTPRDGTTAFELLTAAEEALLNERCKQGVNAA